MQDLQKHPVQPTAPQRGFTRRTRDTSSTLSKESLPSPLPPAFICSCPSSWRFEHAALSGDGVAPLKVRVYLHRQLQHTDQLIGTIAAQYESSYFVSPVLRCGMNLSSEILSFHSSPLSLRAGLAPLVPLLSSQFPSAVRAAHWLDDCQQNCLPIVLRVPESWDPPLTATPWEQPCLATCFHCKTSYIAQWFSAVSTQVEGFITPSLPPSTVPEISSPRAPQDPKRRRS